MSAASTTMAAVRNRCQLCMSGVLFGIEELASCEPFFQPVPVCNPLFAKPPAEQHLLAGAACRKVDEAGVWVLDDRAPLVHRVDATRHFDALAPFRLLELGERARVDAAAIPGDAMCERLPLRLQPLLLASVRHELRDERLDLAELLVRFAGR